MSDYYLEYKEGLPESHGTYFVLCCDDEIRQAYFSSFPPPHHEDHVRFADDNCERFWYCTIQGYFIFFKLIQTVNVSSDGVEITSNET